LRDRHGRWVRDAVDAGMSATNDVDPRTAKSCGPDAPTLASSVRKVFPQATVANKPGHRGERDISRKTIARGMPGVSGVTVVTNACAFYTPHAAAGASSARHSLRPLNLSGCDFPGKTRAMQRRERGGVLASWAATRAGAPLQEGLPGWADGGRTSAPSAVAHQPVPIRLNLPR
jgi:hypothetical protein